MYESRGGLTKEDLEYYCKIIRQVMHVIGQSLSDKNTQQEEYKVKYEGERRAIGEKVDEV